MSQKCLVCAKDGESRCPHCTAAGALNLWYCGRECFTKDWREGGHSNLHPGVSGKFVKCLGHDDGSMSTTFIVTNPGNGISKEVEFHLDSKCSSAVISTEVANDLQLKFCDLPFFIGETILADDSCAIAPIHPLTFTVKGAKGFHNPTLVSYVSSGKMCLIGSRFFRNTCAQLDFSNFTMFIPSVWKRPKDDFKNIESLEQVYTGVLQEYYKRHAAVLSAAEMRQSVLPKKLAEEEAKGYSAKIMAAEVPMSFNMEKWTQDVLAGVDDALRKQLQFAPNTVVSSEIDDVPPVPDLLSIEQVEQQQSSLSRDDVVLEPPELV